jgi:hypothetical protein
MEARTDSNNEKFEVLRNTLVSRMGVHQACTEAIQEGTIAKMDALEKDNRNH